MSRRARYLLGRGARAAFVLLFALTLLFVVIHLGLNSPIDATAASPEEQRALHQRKVEFGLTRPLPVQYVDYLHDMATLDFGETWTGRHVAIKESQRVTDVNTIVFHRLKRTVWLWLWTGLVALGLVAVASLATRNRPDSAAAVTDDVSGAMPAFLLALVFQGVFFNLGRLLFGLDWRTFLVDTSATITRPFPLANLGNPHDLLLAAKLAFPPALALAIPLAAVTTRVWRQGLGATRTSTFAAVARAKGISQARFDLKHVLPNAALPTALSAAQATATLVGGTVIVEMVFKLEGLGTLLHSSVARNDYTTLQATVFVFLVLIVAVSLLEDVLYVLADGAPETERRRSWGWTRSTADTPRQGSEPTRRLRPIGRGDGILEAVRTTPRPALVWTGGVLCLLALEFGAVLGAIEAFVPGVGTLPDVPTVLNRAVISNQGYPRPGGGWAGTFLALPAAYAWVLRVVAVYVYAAAWVGWLWAGYRIYRAEYRPTEWAPLDDALERFRRHRWGLVGALILFGFLVAALFAPTLGPMPMERTVAHTALDGTDPDPERGTVVYYDENASQVRSTSLDDANAHSSSTSLARVPPMSYDDFDRFHPLGTTYWGTDLLTELLHGARLYLCVLVVGVGLATALALLFGWLAALGRTTGRAVSLVADAVGHLPALPFVFILTAMFYPATDTIATQVLVMAGWFGVLGWPRLLWALWPTLTTARNDASMAAAEAVGRSRGFVAARGVREGFGPLAVYALVRGTGIVATTAALSYLAHFAPGSPYGLYDWGTFVWRGHQFMLSRAGHTFVFPALALVLLILGLSATATGLRDALDGVSGCHGPGETGRLE